MFKLRIARWLVSLFLIIGPLPRSAGTSIVIVKTKAEIVLGADSRENEITGLGVVSRCKIVSAGDMFFTAAGVTRDSQAYNAWNIARQVVTASSTFMDEVNAFEIAAQASYKNVGSFSHTRPWPVDRTPRKN